VAGDDDRGGFRDTTSHSRSALHPSLASTCPSKTEGAGKAGRQSHPQPRVQNERRTRAWSPQVQPVRPGFPRTMVLTVSFVLSPVTGLSCHGRLRIVTADLASASGCQDHTTSPSASALFVRHATHVHRIPPRVRDDAYAPLVEAGRREIATDLGARESKISFAYGLDDPNQLELPHKIRFLAQAGFERHSVVERCKSPETRLICPPGKSGSQRKARREPDIMTVRTCGALTGSPFPKQCGYYFKAYLALGGTYAQQNCSTSFDACFDTWCRVPSSGTRALRFDQGGRVVRRRLYGRPNGRVLQLRCERKLQERHRFWRHGCEEHELGSRVQSSKLVFGSQPEVSDRSQLRRSK
jgi:hypothetical protein